MAKTKDITAKGRTQPPKADTKAVTGKAKEKPKAIGLPGNLEQAEAEKMLNMPEGSLKYIKNPSRFLKRALRGKGPATKRLYALRQVQADLGYDVNKEKLEDYYGQQYDEEGRPVMEYHEEQTPGFSEWQQYVQGRIDPVTGEVTGLTPTQRAAYYGAQHDPLKAQAAEQYANEGERMAAAGIDPRSGIAASRAMQIGSATARGLAEAGRKTEAENLSRIKDTEKYASDLAALEERKRSANVAADVERQGAIERGMGGLTEMEEKERQFDLEYTEGQRQAKQRREDALKAAKEAEPSTGEKVMAGVGGFMGGLGVGG